MKECAWVRPETAAEVEFVEWTPEGHLRHARLVVSSVMEFAAISLGSLSRWSATTCTPNRSCRMSSGTGSYSRTSDPTSKSIRVRNKPGLVSVKPSNRYDAVPGSALARLPLRRPNASIKAGHHEARAAWTASSANQDLRSYIQLLIEARTVELAAFHRRCNAHEF